MTLWGATLLLVAISDRLAEQPAYERVQYAQLTIRQQIIVRMPAPARAGPQSRPLEWKEGKGLKCVPARSIAGATLLGRNSVDLILRNNRRIRAKLENSCPALDYYNGFYISPNKDGMICADRDAIRSRIGGTCEIDQFRVLYPASAK